MNAILTKRCAGFAVALMGCAIVAGYPNSSFAQANGPEDVKVGIELSVTGNNAESGRDSRRGIDLAIDDLTKAGRLGKKVKLTIDDADDASDSNRAVTAVQHLVSDGVAVIVGGTVSNAVRAALPAAQRAHTAFVVVNSFTAGLTNIGDSVFQVSKPTADDNKKEVQVAVRAFKAKKAAILWAQDNPTTVGFRNDFLAALKEANVPVVVDEAMKALDTDYSAQLRKAQDAGADLLIPNFNAAQNAAVIKQAHSIGYTPNTIGHVGDLGKAFVDVGGKEVVGHIANSGFYLGGTTPQVKAFVAAYQAKYGSPPSAPSALGYQAMMSAGEAIARLADKGQAINVDSIRTELSNLGAQPSVLGDTGKAQFSDRILQYSAYLLRLDDNLQWQIWNP